MTMGSSTSATTRMAPRERTEAEARLATTGMATEKAEERACIFLPEAAGATTRADMVVANMMADIVSAGKARVGCDASVESFERRVVGCATGAEKEGRFSIKKVCEPKVSERSRPWPLCDWLKHFRCQSQKIAKSPPCACRV